MGRSAFDQRAERSREVTLAAGKTLASVGTQDKAVRPSVAYGGNKSAAESVGKLLAEKALAAGIKQVAFDRGHYRYHGRVKALADGAREQGLKF